MLRNTILDGVSLNIFTAHAPVLLFEAHLLNVAVRAGCVHPLTAFPSSYNRMDVPWKKVIAAIIAYKFEPEFNHFFFHDIQVAENVHADISTDIQILDLITEESGSVNFCSAYI